MLFRSPYEERPDIQLAKHTNIARNKIPQLPVKMPSINITLKRPPSGIEFVPHNVEIRNVLSFMTTTFKPASDPKVIKPAKALIVDMVYVYNPSEPYKLLMVFESMDQVYRNEAKIAFQRQNNSSRGGQDISLLLYEPKNETSWLEVGPFSSLGSAMGYFDEIAPNMSKIIPWLSQNKYQLLIISENNLEILKTRKDISEYLLFIRQYTKEKF